MDTKNAIEIITELKRFKYLDKCYLDIIELLQRGEKYEKIFNTILNWTMHDGSFIPIKELINLEQKYFPKDEAIK